MNRTRSLFLGSLAALSVLFPTSLAGSASAQSQARPLITSPVDASALVPLKGSVSPRISGAQDLGAVDPSQPAGRLLLMLSRSPEQESDLQAFLQQAHQAGSASFHKWLSPVGFSQRFGLADSDVQQLTAWLQAQGLIVAGVSAGKTAIEFNGTVAQVQQAFRTSIHRYQLNGETHFANATAPLVPAAFSAAIAGVAELNDFYPKPLVKQRGQVSYNAKTHTATPGPNWTYPPGYYSATLPLYLLAPEDVSLQYDIKPVYTAGINGTGQTIGIINDSNIDINLVNAYRTLFNLPANPPQVVIDGVDPGINGDAVEAYLDVENAGAVAPNATVTLYTAGSYGLGQEAGLDFALLRAVNDDAASILSVSFGGCEAGQGAAGNIFINNLWEQAAAQGQTVFVSSGDTGSYDDCHGRGVNGLASSPWDVAVGGTDIYLADYATGGSSIASFWSNANDAALGSLQKQFPEQPWNGSQFGLNSITYDPVIDQPDNEGAGGGGPSNCVQSTDPTGIILLASCTSGWPKPAYQAGPGVPTDGARDLPDVSLFASNGYNGVVWPICAAPGDCTEPIDANGPYFVTAVGGTSASAPAMAGIMALIDQKYGPQGQANYTLYPLAAQYPTAFNSVAVGSNNLPCFSFQVQYDLDCAKDANDAYYSYQGFYATAGFDEASGLGSVDVNQMLTYWSKISFKSSTTTLALSPTTFTHGATSAATVTVTGTGTPAGSVTLVDNLAASNTKSITFIPLTAGSGTAKLTDLPGGTYTIVADYSGDGTNGASASAPVTMTVTPEASKLLFTPQYLNATTNKPAAIVGGANVPYNSNVLLDVTVAGAAGTVDGNASGYITFTDGGTTLAVVPIGSGNTAQFNASLLPVGSHTIGVSYSGDSSFNASTATAVQFNIVQAKTYIYDLNDFSAKSSFFGPPTYNAGQNANIAFLVGPGVEDGGACPTGTVTAQLGSAAPVTSTLLPNCVDNGVGFYGYTTDLFSNLQVGTYTLTFSYSGDANYLAATNSEKITVVASTLLPSTVTLTSTPSSLAGITPASLITLTATVTGNGTKVPTGTAMFGVDNFLAFSPVPLVAGSNGTATASIVIRATSLEPGPNEVIATYSGDTSYSAAVSTTLVVTSDPTNFSIGTTTPEIGIKSGSTGSGTVTLASVNAFAGSVALTCTAPASLICTLPSSSVALAAYGNGTATVNINTVVTTIAGNERRQAAPFRAIGGSVAACLLLLLLPQRRRYGRVLFALFVYVALGTGIGCAGKSSQPAPITTYTYTNAKPGNYNVLVTGTAANGLVHNQNITVVVQ